MAKTNTPDQQIKEKLQTSHQSSSSIREKENNSKLNNTQFFLTHARQESINVVEKHTIQKEEDIITQNISYVRYQKFSYF